MKKKLLLWTIFCALLAQPIVTAEVDTHFILKDLEDWDMALMPPQPTMSFIRPMEPSEWDNYMSQFNEPGNLQGDPYPATQFLPPELYVWDCHNSPPGPGSCPDEDSDAGLVMAWGDDQTPPGEYASAFVYQYGSDPDLSSSTLSIQVEAPCGITQISVGMTDIAGNIRAWYWNVAPPNAPGGPGLLTCSPDVNGNPVRHTITINLSQTGINAAAPVSASYSSSPLFDITKVMSFSFDENFSWVASAPVPPPGQPAPKPWNYWFNLIVKPNKVKMYKGYFVKYSQPSVELEPDSGLINGWDEPSVHANQDYPIMADDWECIDQRPVTDIHWWGSFLGWTEKVPPPDAPFAFHLGIWTDVPANPDDPDSFSHPGRLIWENYCDSWVWNFAGVDIDPRPDGMKNETCFQFNQLLSEDQWFYQQPNPDGTPNVYWLHIAAIYVDGQQVMHPWGWKTRPHFFNDDAVRILDPVTPSLDSQIVDYQYGVPVEFPEGVSWDLAFELTTNMPEDPRPIGSADLDHSGFVDVVDIALFGQQWLTAGF